MEELQSCQVELLDDRESILYVHFICPASSSCLACAVVALAKCDPWAMAASSSGQFLTTSQAKTDGMAPNKEFFRLFVTATGSGADLLF
jgi:hypothetical protein